MKKMFMIWIPVLISLQVLASGENKTIPAELIGNWINTANNEWEYGFFEDFAIYRSGFWDYKTVEDGKKQVLITLGNGKEELKLRIRKKDGVLKAVSCNGKAFNAYRPYHKTFLPYPGKDTTSFPQLQFVADTVTLLGYLRHVELYQKQKFEIGVQKLAERGQLELVTDIDSLGRFCMKIPVNAPQLVFLDWGRILRRIIVSPGETVMMYVNVEDLMPTEEDRNDRKYRFCRDRDIVFMGENARLHNEFTHCPYPWMRGMYELKDIAKSDMDFLQLAKSDYENYQKEFEAVRQKYPTLSRRCVEAVNAGVKYELAATLMQNRFNIPSGGYTFDDPAYMDYVNRNFSPDSVLFYFITRDYGTFVNDYTGYVEGQAYRPIGNGAYYRPSEDQVANALKILFKEGKLPELEGFDFEKYALLRKAMIKGVQEGDSVDLQKLLADHIGIYQKAEPLLAGKEVGELTGVLRQRQELLLYDTLLSDIHLREILTAQYFIDYLEHDRIALTSGQQKLMSEKLTTPLIRQEVEKVNAIYEALKNKTISYPESLKNPEDFKDITDADSLWKKMLEPYRGKVVVLDIWGSWCGPCKSMMPHGCQVKKEFEGQEVVFMYFAYMSPEEPWKNVIKEFDLSGPQVVHYNLRQEQQALITRKLGIQGYPTYILIDREGNIVNEHMTFPDNQEKFAGEIRNVLK